MKNWIKSALLGAFLVCASAAAAYGIYASEQWKAAHHPQHKLVQYNHGGLTDRFLTDYAASRRRGDVYKIDGFCESACTYILGTIPSDRVCITPYAVLGFHAAFYIDDKDVRHFAYNATAEMWIGFPPAVKDFLKKNGWSGPTKDQENLIFMGFDDLKAVYRVCGPKE